MMVMMTMVIVAVAFYIPINNAQKFQWNKLVKLIYDIGIPILSLYPEELNAGS